MTNRVQKSVGTLTRDPRWGWALVLVLLGVCAVRILTFANHDPLLSLANNYDMVRIQACHQFWPADPSTDRTRGTPAAPIDSYVRQPELDLSTCFPSSELVFTAPLAWLGQADQPFSIQRLMWIKAGLLLVLTTLLVVILARASMGLGLISAVLAAVLLPDPLNLLYLGTFYTEFSALLGFAMSGLLIALSPIRALRPIELVLLILAVGLLGLSRTQHLVMPMLLLGAVLLSMGVSAAWRTRRRELIILLVAGVAVLGVQMSWMGSDRNESVRQANATNVFLHGVLGSAQDPESVTQSLGLPDHCAMAAGKSWFSEGVAEQHPCPEALSLSRSSLLLLPFREPALSLSILRRMLDYLTPLIPEHVGHVARLDHAHHQDYRRSITEPLANSNRLTLLLLAILAFLPAVSSAVPALRRRLPALTNPGLVFLALCVPIVPAISFAGDGFSDLAKHSHLAINAALASIFVQSLVMLAAGLRSHFKPAALV